MKTKNNIFLITSINVRIRFAMTNNQRRVAAWLLLLMIDPFH